MQLASATDVARLSITLLLALLNGLVVDGLVVEGAKDRLSDRLHHRFLFSADPSETHEEHHTAAASHAPPWAS